MFKSEEQVKKFVDVLEKFVAAVVTDKFSTEVEDAAHLGRKRTALDEFLLAACGITPFTDTTDTLSCPDCGAEMVLRTNRESGNKFYGCKKFPNCRGTRDENGLSKAEREEAKYKSEQAVQQSGFSFNRDKRNVVTEVSPPKPSFLDSITFKK